MSHRAFDKYNPVSWSSDTTPATDVPVHIESSDSGSNVEYVLEGVPAMDQIWRRQDGVYLNNSGAPLMDYFHSREEANRQISLLAPPAPQRQWVAVESSLHAPLFAIVAVDEPAVVATESYCNGTRTTLDNGETFFTSPMPPVMPLAKGSQESKNDRRS